MTLTERDREWIHTQPPCGLDDAAEGNESTTIWRVRCGAYCGEFDCVDDAIDSATEIAREMAGGGVEASRMHVGLYDLRSRGGAMGVCPEGDEGGYWPVIEEVAR
jgi:hypothetical protein